MKDISYNGERYANVRIKWDEDGIEQDDTIIIAPHIVHDSYEDQRSVFHCLTYEEFVDVMEHGDGDFHIIELYGFSNEL